jgi:hypothetical protein
MQLLALIINRLANALNIIPLTIRLKTTLKALFLIKGL